MNLVQTLATLLLVLTTAMSTAQGVLDHEMTYLDGQSENMALKYDGKVVLVVNVASHCGYTRQYEDLQKLHEKYAGQGLAIVGAPCNQFGAQEPGSSEEIAAFCQKNYGVEFDMLAKLNVNPPEQNPLYQELTTGSAFPGKVRWNFEKFLISKDGEVVKRYKSGVEPLDAGLVADIEAQLGE